MARITNADQLMLGDEPIGSYVDTSLPNYKERLIRTLNWYAYDHGQEHAKKFMVEFMKKMGVDKTQIKKVESTKETKFIPSYGFVLRMITRGANIDPTTLEKAKAHIDEIVNSIDEKKETPKEETTRPSVRDFLNEKIHEYLGDVEGYLDDFIIGNPTVDFYNDMKSKQLSAHYVKPVVELLQSKLPELKAAIGGDTELVDAYGYLSTARLKKYIKYIEESITSAEKYGEFKKANRKAPVRKAKPPSVQVAKLNYKREDTDFKLTSVLATDILGAEQLWVFNTKTKKLGVYRATGATGLGVKGSSIINYDPETSTQKTLRKPDEVLQKCLKGGKLILRQLLNGVNAKSSTLNGRINNEVILVKVVK